MVDEHRIALVTGANSGIGRATALGLAERGFHVVLWCRDAARGEQVADQANVLGSAELVVGDLADPEAIARGVAEVADRHEHLDVLINNAGLYVPARREAPDGIEFTFAVNTLAGFRLAHHLRPQLSAAPRGRVVNVASRSHAEGRIELDDLQKAKRYGAYRAYADSKLAVLLLTRAMGRRLSGSTLVAHSVHPGIVGSEFAQDEPSALRELFRFARPFMRTPKRAADTLLWLAEHPEPEPMQGAYLSDRKVLRPARRGRDDAMAEALWERCTKLASDVPPWPHA